MLCTAAAGVSSALAETKPAAVQARKAPPIYVPPDSGAPVSRVAAATRGPGGNLPHLFLFVPEHTGLAGKASPALYWYLSRRFSGPIEVALEDERRIDPVLSLRLDRGADAGVHAVSLAERGIALEPGVEYQWSVELVVDPMQPSANVHASGTIRRVVRDDLPRIADDAARLQMLAANGLWFDAIELSSRLISKHPEDEGWRATRAALLQQVDLAEPAAFDRNAAAATRGRSQ
jgi:hypothetical protein